MWTQKACTGTIGGSSCGTSASGIVPIVEVLPNYDSFLPSRRSYQRRPGFLTQGVNAATRGRHASPFTATRTGGTAPPTFVQWGVRDTLGAELQGCRFRVAKRWVTGCERLADPLCTTR